MARGKNQHVVPRDSGWAVLGEGNSRDTVRTNSRQEALDRAREIAINQRSQVIIHGQDGRVHEKIDYTEVKPSVPSFDQIWALVLNAPYPDKARLAEKLNEVLERDLKQDEVKKPKRSLYGLCADLGTAPSAEDIDEVRGEVWSNFPREDI